MSTTIPFRFADFEHEARSLGCEEVAEKTWPADTVLETHSHPYHVIALVVRGEMWLETGEGASRQTRHLGPGERFELGRNRPHAERYGAQGATYWVGRRHGEGRTIW